MRQSQGVLADSNRVSSSSIMVYGRFTRAEGPRGRKGWAHLFPPYLMNDCLGVVPGWFFVALHYITTLTLTLSN